jgi:hypothetical protein
MSSLFNQTAPWFYHGGYVRQLPSDGLDEQGSCRQKEGEQLSGLVFRLHPKGWA